MSESEYLTTERDAILDQLADLAGLGVSVAMGASEGGRSIDAASARKSLQDRLDWINVRLAQLSGPFAISSQGVT